MYICKCKSNYHAITTVLAYIKKIHFKHLYTGADPGFQVREAHLKKLRRAEGGAKMFEVFRVKNHDFTQTNHNFSNGSAPENYEINICYFTTKTAVLKSENRV